MLILQCQDTWDTRSSQFILTEVQWQLTQMRRTVHTVLLHARWNLQWPTMGYRLTGLAVTTPCIKQSSLQSPICVQFSKPPHSHTVHAVYYPAMSDFIIKLYNSYLDTIYLKMRVLKKKEEKKRKSVQNHCFWTSAGFKRECKFLGAWHNLSLV